MHGIKSAKLAISKVALLIPCMEFENFYKIWIFILIFVLHNNTVNGLAFKTSTLQLWEKKIVFLSSDNVQSTK